MNEFANRNVFRDHTIRIGSNYPSPCVATSSTTSTPTDYNQLTSGTDFYLIQFLASHYNFTYDVIHGNFKFGTILNGTIDGVCGMVNRTVIN